MENQSSYDGLQPAVTGTAILMLKSRGAATVLVGVSVTNASINFVSALTEKVEVFTGPMFPWHLFCI